MTAPEVQPPILRQVEEGVATLTLNRPEKRNALNEPLTEGLSSCLEQAGEDPDVRVVALRGAGRDFCAGADLAELAASRGQGPEEGLAQAQRLGDVFVAIRSLPKPVVAVVEGRALGGGCGLAAACDLVLAHEEARFSCPEVRIGFVPALVLAVLRRKVGEAAAFELVTSGTPIGPIPAVAIGLANYVIRADDFESDVQAYLAGLANRPPHAVALTKRLLYSMEGASFEDAIARGAEVNAMARLTQECKDGVDRFLGRRG